MLDDNITSVTILDVIMLNVVMLNVVMLNVVMLNVVMLNVVAPARQHKTYLSIIYSVSLNFLTQEHQFHTKKSFIAFGQI
jgi:hypothetical protein